MLLFTGILLFPVFLSCSEKEQEITVASVTLSQPSAEMIIGESISLRATISPSNATAREIMWASSKQSVATVDRSGRVVAVAEGTSTITATAGGKVGSCIVTVSKGVVDVSSINLDKTSASLKVGETVTLTATVKPDDATDKTVTWSTSDASIATVENGVVTAIKLGSATITAKAGDKEATCTITVEATPVISVTLDKTSASLKVGETVTLTATVKPDDATDKTVTWSTSDASVATISAGVVTAIKPGSVTITAKAGDKEATCAITVEAIPVTAISLNKEDIYLTEKGSMSLVVEITPSDATNTTIIWESTNTNVAIVSEGCVQAIGVGTSTIKASSEDGNFTASCAVNVIHLDDGAVDLGLSVKWASCNIGATSPEEFGYYFAWADTNGYVRNADDTGWVLASDHSVSRLFNVKTYETTPAYSVFVDIAPDSGYDAARENWGGEWRLPTSSEFNRLKNNCDNRLINLNGKDGLLFTSKINGYTDKSVFFPIDGGYASNDWLGNYSDRCSYYWTNHFVINDEPLYFRCGDRGVGCFYGSIWNYLGINIRPVQ